MHAADFAAITPGKLAGCCHRGSCGDWCLILLPPPADSLLLLLLLLLHHSVCFLPHQRLQQHLLQCRWPLPQVA
jgi:hypothetical protein